MDCQTNGAASVTGVTESAINLKIAFKVKSLLEQNDVKVILTRENENGIQDLNAVTIREKKNSDLKNRLKIGNNSNADLFISIHLNHIPQEQYYGAQTFYKKADEDGKIIADLIQDNLKKTIEIENKRVALAIKNKYIIDNMEIPTCIVECGFLSNVKEAELLQQNEYQDKIAKGIYLGIMEYFN